MSRVAASAFKCNFYYRFACQFSLKVVFYEPITCNNESHFKDGYRIKTPRNKTPVRTKIMNMNIKSRLCKRFDKEREKKKEKTSWKIQFFLIGSFCIPILFHLVLASGKVVLYEYVRFAILSLSTRKQYSCFLKRFSFYRKFLLKLKYLKRWKLAVIFA